jgi:hypothetical protein
MGVALLSTMAAQGLRERMTSSLARGIAANIAKLPGLKAAAFEKLAEQVAPITG